MSKVKNPILTGFHADPCICRKGDDYYIAVSSFEWFPGIPVYHSKDLKNWELYTHILSNDEKPSLKGLPSGKGIWAPCLTYSESDDMFYVVFGVMHNMNARYFDIENYVIKSKSIKGPWSEPVFLHSAGFDASLFHDDNGRKWLVSLEWETRDGYDKPGEICITEYDEENKKILFEPKRIWRGSTERGCIEGPHLYKIGDYYYLMCAEGGTGYGHAVTVGRSKSPLGPYEKDPEGFIISAYTEDFAERENTDHLRPHRANPNSNIQKSGHGSIVTTKDGEIYMTFLCSRPFFPELRCTLGRETGMTKLYMSDDKWLRAKSKLVSEYYEPPKMAEVKFEKEKAREDFDGEIPISFYSPRIDSKRFATTKKKKGYLEICGKEALTSLYNASLLAKKLPSVYCDIETSLDFNPTNYHHSAGLTLYYDNMNFICLQKYFDEKDKKQKICVLRLKNGERFVDTENAVSVSPEKEVIMKLKLRGRMGQFFFGYDENNLSKISNVFDVSEFSDEYCKFGEFTGTFCGVYAWDSMLREKKAYFDYFEMKRLEEPSDWQHQKFCENATTV